MSDLIFLSNVRLSFPHLVESVAVCRELWV